MKLCELVTRGLRLPDRTYSFRSASGAAQPVVLITSPPAMGKTTLLRAIAAAKEGFAAYGPPVDLSALLRPGASGGLLAARWLLSEDEVKAAGITGAEQLTEVEFGPGRLERKGERGLRELWMKPSSEPGVGKLELFPAGRRLCTACWSASLPPYVPPIEDGKRLSAEPDKYLVLARVLHDAALAQAERGTEDAGAAREQGAQAPASQRLAAYAEAVEHMAASLRLTSVRLREGTVSVRFTRSDGSSVGIAELSASQEQAVLFAFVHAWRQLHHSVLLIDSPELGLHGAQHVEFFDRLRRLGTDSQVIAATGSEALLRRAQPSQVIDVSGADSRVIIEAARREEPADGLSQLRPAAERAVGAGAEAAPPALDARPVLGLPVVPIAAVPVGPVGPSPWAAGADPGTPMPAATPSGLVLPDAATGPGLDETGAINLALVLGAERAVPFEGSAPPPRPAVSDDPKPGSSAPDEMRAAPTGDTPDDPLVGETGELDVSALRNMKPALPFGGAGSAAAPEPDGRGVARTLTLEQYASFCAELEVTPSETARILRDYGIPSPVARTALSVSWGRELECKPELRVKFEELRRGFADWLRTHRRGQAGLRE